VDAMSWFREPDFHPNYRRLYDPEGELNGQPPKRFELLSIWRLARDDGYAKWAKDVGTEACEISFFGTQETNDWFSGEKEDCIAIIGIIGSIDSTLPYRSLTIDRSYSAGSIDQTRRERTSLSFHFNNARG